MIEWVGPLCAPVPHLLLPIPVPKDREDGGFSLLCHHQTIIICCSAFHINNQLDCEQTRQASTWESSQNISKTFIFSKVHVRDNVINSHYNCTTKHISSIIYTVSQKSRTLILVVQGQIRVYVPGKQPGEHQPICLSLARIHTRTVYSNVYAFIQFLLLFINCQILWAKIVNSLATVWK